MTEFEFGYIVDESFNVQRRGITTHWKSGLIGTFSEMTSEEIKQVAGFALNPNMMIYRRDGDEFWKMGPFIAIALGNDEDGYPVQKEVIDWLDTCFNRSVILLAKGDDPDDLIIVNKQTIH